MTTMRTLKTALGGFSSVAKCVRSEKHTDTYVWIYTRPNHVKSVCNPLFHANGIVEPKNGSQYFDYWKKDEDGFYSKVSPDGFFKIETTVVGYECDRYGVYEVGYRSEYTSFEYMRLRGMNFSEIDRFQTPPTEGVICEYTRVKALISENLKQLKSFNKFFKRELKNAIWE